MTLEAFGWNDTWAQAFAGLGRANVEPGRVAVEDKHHYVVLGAGGELIGRAAGRLLHEAASTADLPKVGDWVAFKKLPREEKAMIHCVLPRRTRLSRKVPGRETEEQVMVANVDIAFIVQGLDQSFNPAVVQRHLLMAHEGGVMPVVVLNKVDLCEDVLEKLAAIERMAADAPVVAVSAKTGQAMDSLKQLVRPGQTIVFIGASGVGKSTLINQLYGEEIQATAEVRERDAKGRHTTSWRELILLPNGGLVIDTPGMREFHMWLAEGGVHEAFPDIDELAVRCHFRECGHTVEKRCAVLAAVDAGELPRERYEQYLKLKRELDFLSHAHDKRAQIERRRSAKLAQRAFNKWRRGIEEE